MSQPRSRKSSEKYQETIHKGHMQTTDDLFGGPQGSPRSEKLILASIQWAERIMEKIDSVGEQS
jgi:hypothetical protein